MVYFDDFIANDMFYRFVQLSDFKWAIMSGHHEISKVLYDVIRDRLFIARFIIFYVKPHFDVISPTFRLKENQLKTFKKALKGKLSEKQSFLLLLFIFTDI